MRNDCRYKKKILNSFQEVNRLFVNDGRLNFQLEIDVDDNTECNKYMIAIKPEFRNFLDEQNRNQGL